MAPTVAVPEMLKRNGLTLQDFDFYEIHEAFAAQVLCTLRAWESEEYCRNRLGLDAPLGRIDPAKINPNGSSLAAGHPFAATGARIVATAAKELKERGGGRVPDLDLHRRRHGRGRDPGALALTLPLRYSHRRAGRCALRVRLRVAPRHQPRARQQHTRQQERRARQFAPAHCGPMNNANTVV